MNKPMINMLIRKLGRENYSVDTDLTTHDVLIVLRGKCAQMIRGWFLKPFLKHSDGIIFLGKRTKIIHRKKISVGKTLTIGNGVEINALSRDGIRIGDHVSILNHTIIECTGVIRSLGEGLVIGNGVGIAQNCFIQVRGKVVIGNDVIFGPNVSIFSETHNFTDPDIPVKLQGETRKGVIIEDGVWIGAGATILDGVTVGRNSVVAAGAVVTRDVPAGAVVGGVPARILNVMRDAKLVTSNN
ncbi:MAG: acyltransferase [Bacteroidales bacterium]|nr:acyltransferase [Bacteroidales bacterium]